MNPVLEFISSKWSFNDLSLKMSLLGKFYEEFFMPIHLDLIHSTIEDIVFTNIIKVNQSAKLDRTDHVYNFEYVESSINDGDVFYLSDITQPVPSNTITAIGWNDTYDILEKDVESDETKYYSGAGTVVPITLKFPISTFGDFIKSEQISFNTYFGDWETHKFYHHFKNVVDNYIEVPLNLICTREQDYDLRMQFETASCRVYTINLKFEISDINNIDIMLYKYKKKDSLSPEDFGAVYIDIDNIEDINEPLPYSVLFSNTKQYIQLNNEDSNIGLNHVIVLIGDYTDSKDLFFDYYYRVLYKNGDKEYTVCISKEFGFEPKNIPQFLLEVMYNNGYKYFAEFYEMSELKGYNIENYTITDGESLCISTNLKFGKFIKEYDWIFENITLNDIIYPKLNTYSPFITHENTAELTPGYYNIIFKYKLIGSSENEIKLNSAFIKK